MTASDKSLVNSSPRQKQLAQLWENLNMLLEKEAKYGGNTPIELINQIKDHRQAIELIEQAIKGYISEDDLEEELKSLQWAFSQGQVINVIVGKVQPPSREVIAEYLQRMSERIRDKDAREIQEKSEILQRLWHQEFYVRRYRQVGVSPRRLDDVLGDYLDYDRPKGVIRNAVMLLADAGVGKTPALNYILTTVADKSQVYYQADKPEATHKYKLVPLLISLSELRPGQDLLPLVRVAFNRDSSKSITLDEAQALLNTYDCLLLLDDLDKVTFTAHSGGIATVRQFMDSNPQERYVLSCRTSTFNYQLGPMDAFVLDELSDTQVKDVLQDRYNERMSRSFSQLTRNRAMLEIIIKENKTDEKNWSRGTLLRSMVRYQLGLDSKLDRSEIDLEMVEAMLEQLAYQMQCQHAYHYSEQQLMEVITEYLKSWHEPYTWRNVVRLLRDTGVMTQDTYRQWRFCNRSTQAYFTAAAVAQNPALLKPILDNISDFWWREPLEIIVGLVDEPSNLLFDLLDRDVLVAAHCLQFVGQPVEQKIINALIDAMIEKMRYERAAGRERLVRLLVETGYPPSRSLLWQMLYREQKSLVIMVIANALANLELYQEDNTFSYDFEDKQIKVERGVEKVVEHWQDYIIAAKKNEQKVKVEKHLIDLLKDPNEKVSGLAAVALGFIGSERAREALLEQLCEPSTNDFVGWCVVEALTQIKQLQVEKAAIHLYQQPKQSLNHRIWAIYLLGSVGGRYPDTAEILSEALHDRNNKIRGYAARAIGQLGLVDDRQKLEGLLEKPEREPNSWALRRHIEALGKVGTLESIPILEQYLRHEKLRTRRRAREAIIEIRQRYELI